MTDKFTPGQKRQFNKMLDALRTIANDYQSPDQLRKTSKGQYGLGYEETLEMAYENIQELAKSSSRGVRRIESALSAATKQERE